MAAKYAVYVISGKNKPVKIGYAKEITKRLSALQTGSPDQLTCWYELSYLSLAEAKRVEKLVHSALSEKRIRGEWFDVSIDEAADTIWSLVDGRVYSARILTAFDTRPFIAPEKLAEIAGVSLRSIEKQCPSNQDNQETQAVAQS